jgi:hypothetical protein
VQNVSLTLILPDFRWVWSAFWYCHYLCASLSLPSLFLLPRARLIQSRFGPMLAISEYLTVVRLSVINAAVIHRKKKIYGAGEAGKPRDLPSGVKHCHVVDMISLRNLVTDRQYHIVEYWIEWPSRSRSCLIAVSLL